QPRVDRCRLVVVEDRVDEIRVTEGVRRDRAVGLRSEGALVAERYERREELALGPRPLRRAFHHLLEQLTERLPEELGSVAERERDVGHVAVALLKLGDLRGWSRRVPQREPHPIPR